MKAVADYSPYGWRARIGLIVPSTNTIIEPEFYRMAPKGVTIHTARALLLGRATEESYFQMADAVKKASEELATAEIDIALFGCTSGSIVCPLQQIVDDMGVRTGTPALATAGAVVSALRAFGVRRVALGTPYVSFVNDSEQVFLEENGFSVVSMHGLQLGETQEERRGIGRVPPEHLYRLARRIDRPDAEAIFLSCTNLATLDIIEAIEADLGKPVITSNQATFWAALRTLGLPDAVPDCGRLMREKLAPLPVAPGSTVAEVVDGPGRMSA